MELPPVRSLSFTLVRADALAYETLPRELGGWRLVLFIVWVGLAGAIVSLLPETWVGAEGGSRFWAFMAGFGLIQYGLAVVAMTLSAHRRSALRLPRPVAIVVEDHVDHLTWREGDRVSCFAPETFSAVIVAARHVFVPVGGRVLILPARAFESDREMASCAADLDRRMGA